MRKDRQHTFHSELALHNLPSPSIRIPTISCLVNRILSLHYSSSVGWCCLLGSKLRGKLNWDWMMQENVEVLQAQYHPPSQLVAFERPGNWGSSIRFRVWGGGEKEEIQEDALSLLKCSGLTSTNHNIQQNTSFGRVASRHVRVVVACLSTPSALQRACTEDSGWWQVVLINYY